MKALLYKKLRMKHNSKQPNHLRNKLPAPTMQLAHSLHATHTLPYLKTLQLVHDS
jgi:hypothetical protein